MSDKVAVVYFSQTGNTEAVARAIARGLEASGAKADLLRLESTDPAALKDYDFIGFGTPVFYFRLPFNVAWFVKSLGGMEGKHAFGFLTDGGHPGNTMRELARRLAKRGMTMVDGYRCLGVDTYPPFIGTNRRGGHPDAAELAAAEAFGQGLVARRNGIKSGAKELLPVFPREGGRYARLGFLLSRPVVALMSPKKRVNAKTCTRCGACAKQCPTRTIRLDPTPKFGRRCVYCTWCERVCPVHAIECDWTRMKKRIEKSMAEEEHPTP